MFSFYCLYKIVNFNSLVNPKKKLIKIIWKKNIVMRSSVKFGQLI
jgi:hypothetical protein